MRRPNIYMHTQHPPKKNAPARLEVAAVDPEATVLVQPVAVLPPQAVAVTVKSACMYMYV